MLLRRQESKKSKVKIYGIAMISMLILACEIWYVDSLNRREMHTSTIHDSRFPIQDTKTENERSGSPSPVLQEGSSKELTQLTSPAMTGKVTTPPIASLLKEEEKGGGDTHLFSVNDGKLALADRFEYVCSGTSLYASIYVAQLHTKEAK
jgi:hypothetical protein